MYKRQDSGGTPGSGRRTRDARGRGGLRSRGVVLLDKAQSRVEKQLFHDDAVEVLILNDVPRMQHIVKIPLPGEAQALTTGKDAKHVLKLNGDMEAVLGERTFKSFKAFSLSDLMEFHQLVEYVAEYQPEEKEVVTQSVVKAMRVIVRNAIQVYTSMRDSQWLGEDGEHFRAYAYLQVMCLVMLREAYDGALAEMFFWTYSSRFAIKARGCPGMSTRPTLAIKDKDGAVKSTDRCLACGKAGHLASSAKHKRELAEGSAQETGVMMKSALAEISDDKSLSSADKRSWLARIRAFYAKIGQTASAESAAL